MRSWRRIAGALALLCIPTASLHAKDVEIRWEPIVGAERYQLKVSREKRAIRDVDSKETQWNGDLPFGVYSYQIRALDSEGTPGIWSEAKPLAVMPAPPESLSPSSGTEITLYSKKIPVEFKWGGVEGVRSFAFSLKGPGKTRIKKTVMGNSLSLRSLEEGTYHWTVSCILEGGKKDNPSFLGKHWEGKNSEERELVLRRGELSAPVLISPAQKAVLSPGSGIHLSWSPVSGAQEYELKIWSSTPLPSPLPALGTQTTEGTSFEANLPKGEYRWSLRALIGSGNSGQERVAGPLSESSFSISSTREGRGHDGYVAFSSMLAPYTYQVNRTSVGTQSVSTASDAMTARLSGEYYFTPKWGVSAGAEDTIFEVNGQDYNRKSFELMGRYRIRLGQSDRTSWVLSPKAGFELRDYVELDCQNASCVSVSSMTYTAFGPSVGVDLRKQFSDSFSVGAKFGYFFPVALFGAPAGSSLNSDASYRDLSLGLQLLYWLKPRWGVAAGGLYDQRSISFTYGPSSSTPFDRETIEMDATYFFASLIYRFGQ